MPTPVNHLVMAQEMLECAHVSPTARRILAEGWGSFLLGNTAPDVQTVNGCARDATHFYAIPPVSAPPAHHTLLSAHPSLACPECLLPDHAAFVAGYLAHLLADEAWWHRIFYPFFGVDDGWAPRRERIFLHNVLRTYWDREDQRQLDGNVSRDLAAVQPRDWLPFVTDAALATWRDVLVQQLQPGQTVRTAEVFAARMGVSPALLEEALANSTQMARIFARLPLPTLQTYRSDVVRQSVALINGYLGGNA